MSRYCEWDGDWEPWMEGQAAGALQSAIRGRRGQQLLRDLIAGLDALPVPELAAGSLEDPETGCVCAFGAVRLHRGEQNVPLLFHPTDWDADWRELAKPFNISETLAHAVISANEYVDSNNDEYSRRNRWKSVRAWAVSHLLPQGEVQP